MFDEFAESMFGLLPPLEGLEREECRRSLTAAYLQVLQTRITGVQPDTWAETRTYLQRLVNALESFAIFDAIGPDRERERVAAAFVAAESLSLLADASSPPGEGVRPLVAPRSAAAVESALLYAVGGFDVDAVAVLESLPEDLPPPESDEERAEHYLYRSLLSLLLARPLRRIPAPDIAFGRNQAPEQVVTVTRTLCYLRSADAVNDAIDWFSGAGEVVQPPEPLDALDAVLGAIRRNARTSGALADIYHVVSLVRAALRRLMERATLPRIPRPPGSGEDYADRFQAYIRRRVKGSDSSSGRPYLWPSTAEFIDRVLVHDSRNAVVTFPTGSGKSFVAELACAQAAGRGWVLYLAPTNALANQIRRDLRVAFNPMGVSVVAFLGGGEYSSLATTEATLEGEVVAVMTPEKAAVALRLHPELFAQLSLCVFDECHLLRDPKRGAGADILLSELFGVATGATFLLMSAMVQNPGQLADWLSANTSAQTSVCSVNWRPTRTARGLVFVDEASAQAAELSVINQLEEGRRRASGYADLAWIVGLSGPWRPDGHEDYRATRLPASVRIMATAENPNPRLAKSWKNHTARLVAEAMASTGIQTIDFVLTSRHHAFSQARAAGRVVADSPVLPAEARALLTIARSELGGPSGLVATLAKGVCVHTSAMLAVEQQASEMMFKVGSCPLMIATGTLAQGLNLPAVAVVVSGSSVGDPRDIDESEAARASEIILNGFGRAGRAGFSNQALALLVTDRPVAADVAGTVDPSEWLIEYPVLGEADASTNVTSPLASLIDHLLLTPGDWRLADLLLTTHLVSSTETPGVVLSRTYGAQCRPGGVTDDDRERADQLVDGLRSVAAGAGVHDWIYLAALNAGASVGDTWALWYALSRQGLPNDPESLTIRDWLKLLMKALAHLPPTYVEDFFADPEIRTPSARTTLRDLAGVHRDARLDWDPPQGWRDAWEIIESFVLSYMDGEDYLMLAAVIRGSQGETDVGRANGAGPIPSTFKHLAELVYQGAALRAGVFAALLEFSPYDAPEALQLLPLAVRNGCQDLSTLAWFRFGYRQRAVAHALSQRFPLPDGLAENDRAAWIRATRRDWLRMESPENEVLSAARVVLSRPGAGV